MSLKVDVIVRDVARCIQADLESLTAEMTSMFVDVIPEFRHDDAVRRLMVASTSSNLTAIVDMLALSISLDDITVPPAAAEYARRFAQHGLSLDALLRAYRLGEHMFVQWAMTALRRRELSTDEALATTSRIALLANSYIDQVIEGIIDIYEDERRRWDARSDAARAAQVRAVLDTDGLDLASAEKMLSTSLRGWHLAAVIWTQPGSADPDASQLRAGAAMLAAATGRAPLTISADERTYWAWISSTGKPVLDLHPLEGELPKHPALRIAIGDPSPVSTASGRPSGTPSVPARSPSPEPKPTARSSSTPGSHWPASWSTTSPTSKPGPDASSATSCATTTPPCGCVRPCRSSSTREAVSPMPPHACTSTRTPSTTAYARPRRCWGTRSPRTDWTSKWLCWPARSSDSGTRRTRSEQP